MDVRDLMDICTGGLGVTDNMKVVVEKDGEILKPTAFEIVRDKKYPNKLVLKIVVNRTKHWNGVSQ